MKIQWPMGNTVITRLLLAVLVCTGATACDVSDDGDEIVEVWDLNEDDGMSEWTGALTGFSEVGDEVTYVPTAFLAKSPFVRNRNQHGQGGEVCEPELATASERGPLCSADRPPMCSPGTHER